MREVTTGPDLCATLIMRHQLLLVLAQHISVSSSALGCISKLSSVSTIFSHLKYGCAPKTSSKYSCLQGFQTDSRIRLKPLNLEPDKLRM